jgi:hypothetical protein
VIGQQVVGESFAFCERRTATSTSPEHIRTVGPEGLQYGAGAPDTTLCGRSLHGGRDLARPVTTDGVRSETEQQHRGGAPVLCPDCVSTYLSVAA